SGKPVARQPLTIYGATRNVVASGQTDADGVFRTPLTGVRAFDSVFAISEQDGRVVGAVGSDWANGIAPFDYQVPVQYEPQPYYANLYTDRPIYRPGQTVYFIGMLCKYNVADLALPADLDVLPIQCYD